MEYALVVGGSSGIGREIAFELAKKKDMQVIVVGLTEEHLKITGEKYPENIKTIKADISSAEDRKFIINEVQKILSEQEKAQLNYLILNAATEGPVKSFFDTTDEELNQTMQTNWTAPCSLIKSLTNDDILAKQSRILLVSSGLDRAPMEGLTPYCCSKSALHMLWQCLKVEGKIISKEIYVGISNPGVVKTKMQKRLREEDKNPKATMFWDFYNKEQLVKPEFTAKFFMWILSQTKEKFKDTYWDFDIKEIKQHFLKENNIAESDIYAKVKSLPKQDVLQDESTSQTLH